MNTIAYFEIQASDPAKLVSFYEDIFGWKCTRQTGLPIEYYQIETNGIRGGLLKRPAQAPPMGSGTNAFVCSVEVENFDTVAEQILSQGGQVAMPKFAVPGKCWQGYFIDPDHNTFGLFQVDTNAQ